MITEEIGEEAGLPQDRLILILKNSDVQILRFSIVPSMMLLGMASDFFYVIMYKYIRIMSPEGRGTVFLVLRSVILIFIITIFMKMSSMGYGSILLSLVLSFIIITSQTTEMEIKMIMAGFGFKDVIVVLPL